MESERQSQEMKRAESLHLPKSALNNPFSQEVGNFSSSEPYSSASYTSSSSSSLPQDVAIPGFDSHADLSFGIETKENLDGAQLVMKNSSISLSCTVPPKAGSKWSTSFNGQSVFIDQLGFASTQLCIGYRVIDGLAMSYDWRTQDGCSTNAYGLRYVHNDFLSQFHIQFPRQRRDDAAVISFLSTANIRKTLSSHFKIGFEFNSKSPVILQLGIRTANALHEIHKYLPQLKCYYDMCNKLPIQFDYIQENPYNNTKMQFVLGLSRRAFSFKTMKSRNISEFFVFGIGLQHLSWEGLSWVFEFQQADVCLSIPIRLFSPYSTIKGTIVYAIRCAYIATLCQIIQSVLGEVLNCNSRNSLEDQDSQLSQQNQFLDEISIKERIVAEQQQSLMKKKAEASRRAELDKEGGLIIEHAVYAIDGGESIDVTVALQFWVSDSRLILPGECCSYGAMLGFYDITSTYRRQETDIPDQSKIFSMWKMMLILFNRLNTSDGPSSDHSHPNPYLDVRYFFNHKHYYIRANGHETLSLPNPRSIEVEML